MSENSSWWSRLRNGLQRSRTRLSDGLKDILIKRPLDKEMLEEIEELLITCDVGVVTSHKLTLALKQKRFGQDVDLDTVKSCLATAIIEILNPVEAVLSYTRAKPFIILAVGVNGSGKTTTLGKLALQLKNQGQKVLLVAGDTFRAAAVDQLTAWGKRIDVPVLASQGGASDPAALAFEALKVAQNENYDSVMIDTAGRLHNKVELMAELEKIVRVMKKFDPASPHETLLVLDATIGQNAFAQVETFQSLIGLTGLIVTKLDGTARGGVLIGLADRFKLPIYAIGVGETAEDLHPFEAKAFANNLIGIVNEN
jgi:fused signal recognition particle receptor